MCEFRPTLQATVKIYTYGSCCRLFMGRLPPSNQPVRAHTEPEPSHEPSEGPCKVWVLFSSLMLSSSLFLSSNLYLSSSPGLFSSLMMSSSLFLFSSLMLSSSLMLFLKKLEVDLLFIRLEVLRTARRSSVKKISKKLKIAKRPIKNLSRKNNGFGKLVLVVVWQLSLFHLVISFLNTILFHFLNLGTIA